VAQVGQQDDKVENRARTGATTWPVGRVHAFGTGPLLLAAGGLLLLCLLRTPLRLSGVATVLAAALWVVMAPRPDVLVSADGQAAALRGPDGRLAVLHAGRDDYAVEDWFAADADGRDMHDSSLGQGILCDPSGCIGRLADGALVAYALAPDAFAEDCRRAALVIAVHDDPPPDCAAQVVGRDQWRERGALTLRRDGGGFVVNAARPADFDRPWAPAQPQRARDGEVTADGTATNPSSRAPPRDATPQQDDIEADQ
jgi:competence protein ComEC